MNEHLFIDLSYLKNVCNQNLSLYKDFLATYITENKRYLAAIFDALDQGNKKEALEALHKLKGLSATMGLKHFSNICKNLETMLRYYDIGHPKVSTLVNELKFKQESTLSYLSQEIT